MKQILIIVLTLWSGSSFLGMANENYDQLWAEVEGFENDRLPKSAYKIVETIYTKAKKDSNDAQLVKAAIYKLKLSAQFEDKDPAEFILELENELKVVQNNGIKSILKSMLGELYHQYGMRNVGRFQNRTEELDKTSNAISSMALADIQTISYNFYLESVQDIPQVDISEYKVLTSSATDNTRFLMKAETLEQLLYLRAIEHFGNSRSLLALPLNNYSLDDKLFFAEDSVFKNVNVSKEAKEDFKLEALRIYQTVANSNLFTEDQKLRFQFKRLEYIRSHSELNDKEKLYVETLVKISEKNSGLPSEQMAFIKLTEYYLQIAESHRSSNHHSDLNAYKEVYRWIQKGKDRFPKGEYNDIVEYQRKRLNAQTLKIQTEQVVVANTDFLANISYRNARKAYFKMIKLSPSELDQYNIERSQDDKLSYLLAKSTLKEWNITLPQADDYNNHNIEIPIEGLDYGTYFLLGSTHAEFKYSDFDIDLIHQIQVSNLSYTHQSRDGNLEGYVLDRNEGLPVSDVLVEVFISKYLPQERRSEWQLVESLKSDSDGFFRVKSTQNNFSIKLTKEKDILDLRVSHYNYGRGNGREINTVNLFTDRAIYRPGQLVYFKGLAMRKSSKNRVPSILANQRITVKFKDANWQDISEQVFRTNEYGTFNGKFVAPSEGLLGRFTIVTELDNGNGQKQIRIEEYKRPKFYVEFDKLKEAKVLGDDIVTEGNVIAFSGAKMSNTTVKYYVLRKQNYYPYYYSWRGPSNQRTEEIISRGETVTDKEGHFKIEFATEESSRKNQSFIYEVKVDVTDITGMTASDSKRIVVNQVPFYFKSNLPSNAFDSDLESIQLEVSNNEGEAIDAKVKMTIMLLESPEEARKTQYWTSPDIMYLEKTAFEKQFPNEAYGDNMNADKWKTLNEVSSKTFEFSKAFGVSLSDLKKGAYKVLFEVSDNNGNKKEYTEYINITSKKGCAIPTDYIWHSNLKSKYAPGDNLKLDLNFPYKKFNVYYRISQSDRVIETGKINKRSNGIEYTIQEADRGDIDVELVYVKHNRIHSKHLTVNVPWENKELKLKVDKFRNRLEPGSEENWTVQVKDNNNQNVTAEVLAGMYDSSLDQFIGHNWKTSFFPKYYAQMRYSGVGFGIHNAMTLKKYNNSGYQTYLAGYTPFLSWFDFRLPYRGYSGGVSKDGRIMKRSGAPMSQKAMPMEDASMIEADAVGAVVEESESNASNSNESNESSSADKSIQVRENLNETVFFYPELVTNNNGETELSFTMNEALTKWKMLVFAHTTDLKYAFEEFEIETYKDLIIEPNLPRFLRQGDQIVLNAKVSNMSDESLEVSAKINFEAYTSKSDVTDDLLDGVSENQNLVLAKGESKIVSWAVKVPEYFTDIVNVKMTVDNDLVSDGELNQLPVLSNRMLVTESMVMHVGALESEVFKFEALRKMDSSSTLDNFNYTLEFYTNPSWLVLKSLPSLMDNESIITTNIFDTYYAKSLGADLVNNDAAVKEVIKQWVAENEKSSLATNQGFKLSDLKETPWVRDSNTETENVRMLSAFLDANMTKQELTTLSKKIKDRQLSNGGFSWTPGGRDNWYITQYILEGLARLNALGVDINTFDKSVLNEAVFYTDQEFLRMYNRNVKKNKNLDPIVVHFLYVRPQYDNVPISRHLRAAIDYYQNLVIENWKKKGSYEQALMAYGLIIDKKEDAASKIVESLKERMVKDEKLGYYWNDLAGYYWYNADVEKQAFMIDLFELTNQDQTLIDGLKLWLLKNKQTNSWKTSKATASAVYAFMKDRGNDIAVAGDVKISLPQLNEVVKNQNPKTDNLIIRKEWSANKVTSKLEEVKIENNNNHVTWGASYWQYFEDLDKVESYTGTPLKLEKKLYKVVQTDKGDQLIELTKSTMLESGDKLRVKIFLNVDRPMEFVQMKDLRGSGLEPINVLSEYKWQDGLGYYESTKDVANYFYFDYLPKGNFVFEYETNVVHKGTFSNGNCSIQSMYAPEFGSHSKGEVIIVE